MKRILLITILSLFSFSSIASPETVEIKKTISPTLKPRPRSVVVAPKVCVDTDICQLTISMVSGESYALYVYDDKGGVVYQGDVVTDGSCHFYSLGYLDGGVYTISIEGSSAAYEGEFYAN